MLAFNPLKRQPLSQEVQEQLLTAITSGVFKPGDKLPSERELMEQFQVSRVTVRQALASLRSKGLVEIRRGVNGGAYVSEPNSSLISESFYTLVQMGRVDFGHLIEARLLQEPALAASAARQHSPEDLVRLEELLAQAEARAGSSPKEARLTNVRFHLEVARITGNPLIIFILESITQAFSALIIEMTQESLSREAILELIREHRAILADIAARRPEEAAAKTREHLLRTYRLYTRIMPVGLGAIDQALGHDC